MRMQAESELLIYCMPVCFRNILNICSLKEKVFGQVTCDWQTSQFFWQTNVGKYIKLNPVYFVPSLVATILFRRRQLCTKYFWSCALLVWLNIWSLLLKKQTAVGKSKDGVKQHWLNALLTPLVSLHRDMWMRNVFIRKGLDSHVFKG